jgi:hypothetical protein
MANKRFPSFAFLEGRCVDVTHHELPAGQRRRILRPGGPAVFGHTIEPTLADPPCGTSEDQAVNAPRFAVPPATMLMQVLRLNVIALLQLPDGPPRSRRQGNRTRTCQLPEFLIFSEGELRSRDGDQQARIAHASITPANRPASGGWGSLVRSAGGRPGLITSTSRSDAATNSPPRRTHVSRRCRPRHATPARAPLPAYPRPARRRARGRARDPARTSR